MRAWKGFALAAALAAVAASSAGCKCAWSCLNDPPAGPPRAAQQSADGAQGVTDPPATRGGVVAIARSNNPGVPIGYVSFDPNDGRHSWWLMSQGEVPLPWQTIITGMPLLPDQVLIYTPVSESSKLPPQLCLDHSPGLLNAVLFDVFLTAAEGQCP